MLKPFYELLKNNLNQTYRPIYNCYDEMSFFLLIGGNAENFYHIQVLLALALHLKYFYFLNIKLLNLKLPIFFVKIVETHTRFIDR